MDLLARKVRRAGQDVTLTNREFALLEILLVNSPKPVSKMAIVEHVWDQHFDSQTNVVNVYVNYLREQNRCPRSDAAAAHGARGWVRAEGVAMKSLRSRLTLASPWASRS